jgi:hypothetical protein
MACSVLHQRAAQITIGPPPRASKIRHRVPYVRLRHEQGFNVALIAQHGSGLRPNLHQADFADGSNSSGIVGTLDVSHGFGNVRR